MKETLKAAAAQIPIVLAVGAIALVDGDGVRRELTEQVAANTRLHQASKDDRAQIHAEFERLHALHGRDVKLILERLDRLESRAAAETGACEP